MMQFFEGQKDRIETFLFLSDVFLALNDLLQKTKMLR